MVTESCLLRNFDRGIARILPLLVDLIQSLIDAIFVKSFSDVNIGFLDEGEF
jgi:hypothetical protein